MMKLLSLILSLLAFPVFAGFEKITIQNLDFEYKTPYGQGTAEKIGVGVSLKTKATIPFPVEVTRTEESFEFVTPYIDFSWKHPLKFLYELEEFHSQKTSLSLGTKTHSISSEFIMVKTRDHNVYKAQKLNALCDGNATGEFDVRLFEDCRKKLHLTIKKIDVPDSFILTRLVQELPSPALAELDIPGDNVVLSVNDGNFSLQVYIRFWVYAGLRAYGQVYYENDYQTVAIKVNQIKFGYLPVTNLVMNKLKELIKSPDVKIDPPWIRIRTNRIYESQ